MKKYFKIYIVAIADTRFKARRYNLSLATEEDFITEKEAEHWLDSNSSETVIYSILPIWAK